MEDDDRKPLAFRPAPGLRGLIAAAAKIERRSASNLINREMEAACKRIIGAYDQQQVALGARKGGGT